jgi:hypothetical protein
MTEAVARQGDFRKALTSLRAAIKLAGEARGLSKSSELLKVVDKMGDLPPPRPPEIAVLERARINLLAAARTPGGVATAERRDLKHAPWLLWAKAAGLAEVPGIFDALYREAQRLGSVRRGLIEAWIANCDANHPSIETCGPLLEQLLGSRDDARLENWRRAQTRFHYFQVKIGPARVASAILNGSEPVAEIIKAAGLSEPARTTTGYARLVNAYLMKELPAPLASAKGVTVFERAQAFVVVDRALRFEEPESRGSLANSLLTPWVPGSRLSAGDGVRTHVQGFLLGRLGDPRTRQANWRHVDKVKTDIMRKWLSRASLKAFFDLIEDHAEDSFIYRRAFWNAYLEAEKIDDSWLALGANVHAEARGVRELQGNFARLKGATGNQSVLLIRIGTVIFSEWSHSGSLRAWSEEWKNAPRIGLFEYQKEDFTGLCLPFADGPDGARQGKGLWHMGSESGRWQAIAAELIARRCGTRLGPQVWMPK